MREEALVRLRELGFDEEAAGVLADHFVDAEERGKVGHGLRRIGWLGTLPGLDPRARPVRVVAEAGYERWEGRGAVGYLTLDAVVRAQIAAPPERARLVVASECFPTGVLGYWARRLAERGLVAALTATSPPRLGSPSGGPPLAGTNPLAVAVPAGEGPPLVADVSMAVVTHGDVLTGRARPEDVVPFGGEQAYKAFALAVGLEALVGALAGESPGAVLLVARPEHDAVAWLRTRAPGIRLPGI
ncbi:MAG TPA: Ldh family oxidoreductase [Gaiellaceae bacterium]|nr:Ldh family oxidoreductase [Gaiellaceae bacterium]